MTTAISAFCPDHAGPRVVLDKAVNGQSQFTVTGSTGTNYVVQAATNLASPSWISLLTNAAPFTFIETNTNSFNSRFYRGALAP